MTMRMILIATSIDGRQVFSNKDPDRMPTQMGLEYIVSQ